MLGYVSHDTSALPTTCITHARRLKEAAHGTRNSESEEYGNHLSRNGYPPVYDLHKNTLISADHIMLSVDRATAVFSASKDCAAIWSPHESTSDWRLDAYAWRTSSNLCISPPCSHAVAPNIPRLGLESGAMPTGGQDVPVPPTDESREPS